MIRVLSLFSGVGMIDLGLQWSGMEIVGQVEIEPYCRAVLDKHWPGLWRREDVTAVSDDDVRALAPDLIAGGFPCQDVSVAGKGKGVEHGERSGLWREFARLVRAARPRWVLAENVPGLRNRGADIVLSDLEQAGYSCWPVVVGAEHVGAPHKRHRVWIVAHAPSGGQRADGRARRGGGHADERGADVDDTEGGRGCGRSRADNDRATAGDEYAPLYAGGVAVANAMRGGGGQDRRAAELRAARFEQPPGDSGSAFARTAQQVTRWPAGPGLYQHPWEAPRLTQPGMGNATDGAARRLAGFARRNALKALGNGAVPQVVAEIGRVIVELDGEMK